MAARVNLSAALFGVCICLLLRMFSSSSSCFSGTMCVQRHWRFILYFESDCRCQMVSLDCTVVQLPAVHVQYSVRLSLDNCVHRNLHSAPAYSHMYMPDINIIGMSSLSPSGRQ
jgi:hypothetical protein